MNARGLYHNRNRSYDPRLGRFTSEDPLGMGTSVVPAASIGLPLDGQVSTLDVQAFSIDGLNRYAYTTSGPLTRHDALGLQDDPFDMVDDYLAEDAGNRAAYMARLVVGFDATVFILAQAAQLYPPIGAAVSVYNIASGQGTLWDVLSFVGGGAGNLIGKALSSYSKGRKALRGFRAIIGVGDDLLELHHVVPQFMKGWANGRVVVLTRGQHKLYHRILDDFLGARGMPKMRRGEKEWEKWMLDHPDRLHEIREVLVESVDEFRRQTRVDMTLDLHIEMARQGLPE